MNQMKLMRKKIAVSRSASFVSKYWFARGYADRIMELGSDAPKIEVNDYYEEITGVNIIEEYNLGYQEAQKDKVNNVI